MFNQVTRAFEFRPGGIFANLVVGDEINRASPKTQSALLECMEERQVTVDGTTYGLQAPFMVIATQNPVEMEGTYALPEAQRDRFMAQLSVGYPVEAAELAMIASHAAADPLDDLEPVTDAGEIRKLVAIAAAVHVSPAVQRYVVALVGATRASRELARGPPRARRCTWCAPPAPARRCTAAPTSARRRPGPRRPRAGPPADPGRRRHHGRTWVDRRRAQPAGRGARPGPRARVAERCASAAGLTSVGGRRGRRRDRRAVRRRARPARPHPVGVLVAVLPLLAALVVGRGRYRLTLERTVTPAPRRTSASRPGWTWCSPTPPAPDRGDADGDQVRTRSLATPPVPAGGGSGTAGAAT